MVEMSLSTVVAVTLSAIIISRSSASGNVKRNESTKSSWATPVIGLGFTCEVCCGVFFFNQPLAFYFHIVFIKNVFVKLFRAVTDVRLSLLVFKPFATAVITGTSHVSRRPTWVQALYTRARCSFVCNWSTEAMTSIPRIYLSIDDLDSHFFVFSIQFSSYIIRVMVFVIFNLSLIFNE